MSLLITGYSGRFPEADSIQEFYALLAAKKNLATTPKRYPLGYHGLPDLAGHLNTVDRFDSKFFKMNQTMAEGVDPQIRILLEVVYEAMLDAGLSIKKVKGTNTGVYVGNCFSDYHTAILSDIGSINGFENVGSCLSMAANKISYFFDMTGPSFAIDTACSSSLFALDRACQDILNGKVDRAIVAGVSMNFRPAISAAFLKYNMLSPTGSCKSFDKAADGYCRAEAIGAVIIESSRVFDSLPETCPPRCYAKVAGFGVNTNGGMETGITLPCAARQFALIQEIHERFHVEKGQIGYIEAHGTGTIAGDHVEITALDKAYGDATRVVKLGSVKSNMGHAEGASGIASLIKCLMMYETGVVIPNLHYSGTTHEPILENRFRVVTECEQFDRSEYIAINNFGFGGANSHVILSPGNVCNVQKTDTTGKNDDATAKAYYVYGRTEQNVRDELLHGERDDFYLRNSDDIEKFPYRGVISAVSSTPNIVRLDRAHLQKLVYVFSGQGSQHVSMGCALYKTNDIFRSTIQRLSGPLAIITENSIQLTALFDVSPNGNPLWNDRCYSGIGITSIQIALVNMLRAHGYQPDYIVGHSLGEIACSYADDCLTETQCIQIASIRSKMVQDIDPDCYLYYFNSALMHNGDDALWKKSFVMEDDMHVYLVAKTTAARFEEMYLDYVQKIDCCGKMLFVSLTVEAAEHLLTQYECKSSVIACYNNEDGLTLSGPSVEIDLIAAEMVAKGIFHRVVETDRIAYHSPLLKHFKSYLFKQLTEIIPTPKLRSSRWLSTSDLQNKYCDAQYHVTNILQSVFFYQALSPLPDDCVFLEIGPNDGMLGVVKRCRPSVFTKNVACMSKKSAGSEVATVEKMYDQLWLSGVPCSSPATMRSHSEQPLLKRKKILWDHDDAMKVCSYKDFETDRYKIIYDLQGKHSFLMNHVVKDNIIVPGMCHLYTIWQCMGLKNHIVVENFQVHAALGIKGMNSIEFNVFYDTVSGNITIFHEGEKLCTATSKVVEEMYNFPDVDGILSKKDEMFGDTSLFVDHENLYRQFHRKGLQLAGEFQVLNKLSASVGSIRYAEYTPDVENVLLFLDGCLQAALSVNLLGVNRQTALPTNVGRMHLKGGSAFLPSNSFPRFLQITGTIEKGMNLYNNISVFEGLRCTETPKVAQEEDVVRSEVVFMPYGSNVDNSITSNVVTQQYQRVLKTLIHSTMLKLEKESNFFQEYDHLVHVKSYLTSFMTEDAEDEKKHEMLNAASQLPLIAVAEQLYSDLEYFLLDPIRFIDSMKGAHQIFEKDPLCISSSKAMHACVDIIHENIFGDFTIMEFGVGAGGGFRRFHPYVSAFIQSYTATDIGKVNIDGFSDVTVLNWDFNNAYPVADKSFQVIYGCQALSYSKNIVKSLQHIHNCLTDGGFVLLEEFTSALPVFLWGLSSDAWNTVDVRDFGLWNTHDHWVNLFNQSGFDVVISFDNSIVSLFLLRKKRNLDASKTLLVTVTDNDFNSMNSYLSAVQDGSIQNYQRTIFVGRKNKESGATDGAGVLGMVRCIWKEPEASVVAGYYLDNDDDQYEIVPQLFHCLGAHLNLLANVVRNNIHGSYRQVRSLTYEPAENWVIKIEKPGFLNTLGYCQAKAKSCDIYYSSLNFKDVVITYGRIRDKYCQLGLDFSGLIKESGKRVMAIAKNSFAFEADASEFHIWEVPPQWSLQEAVTIPTPYYTAYCCLDYKARAPKTATVLIHGGSGAVGQAVLNICLKRGMKVIVTCSDSKRAFLKERFHLTDDDICNSRDNSFYEFVMKKTNYEGVDVVINSLAEEKLLLSLDCVKESGHFCEIGKYDILQDSKIGLKIFEKNVSFHGIDISLDAPYDNVIWSFLKAGLSNGEIQPITIDSVYHHSEIESAIRKMGSGKHLGKIIMQMREDPSKPAAVSTGTGMPFHVRPQYYTSGTHIITGGFGGFGMELAEWLVTNGAEKVLLLSRYSDRKPNETRKLLLLPQLKDVQVDVTNESQVEELLKAYPQTIGIWHLAVIFKDALFKNMTESLWKSMMDVKCTAANYLDKYSRLHCPQLHDFVCFSSISSVFGLAGQTHYGYANAYLEDLARKRERDHLPGKTICWGRIGNVGYIGAGNKVTNLEEFSDQHIDSCLLDMHNLLLATSPVICCYKNSGQGTMAKDVLKVTAFDLIVRTLRIDPQKVSDNETLTDLGVDSLQIVTIKSIFKTKGHDLNIQDLYGLTVKKIREMP